MTIQRNSANAVIVIIVCISARRYGIKELIFNIIIRNNCFFESLERLEILFSKASNFSELLDIFEKESQNLGYKQVYLIMNSDYVDSMSGDITQFSDIMYLMGISYHQLIPDKRHIYQKFPKKEILPQAYKSRYMIYTSLSNNGVAIGYLAFDHYSTMISVNFMTIILKLLGLTIEGIRKEQVLSILNERLEDLSIKDSLTHLYNRFGMNHLGKSLFQSYIKKILCTAGRQFPSICRCSCYCFSTKYYLLG